MLRQIVRVLIKVIGSLLLILGLIGTGFTGIFAWNNSGLLSDFQNPLPPEFAQGQVRCRLWDDDQQIPHVQAKDLTQGYACFGYVHGRDRAWQMDYLRRLARGRLAEVQGYSFIRTDFTMRLLGLSEKAESLFKQLDENEKKFLWAYAFGVNAGFKAALKQGVYEFKEFSAEPEPWHPIDTLTLILLQSFEQTRKGFETDLSEDQILARHGKEALTLFLSDGLPWDTAILKMGEFPLKGLASLGESPSSLESSVVKNYESLNIPELGTGSNNWVVAPPRSQTQNAWMANDPHLGLKHPPFWHWSHVQVESGELDVIGASLPGVPVVVSGANRNLAWGLTNSYLDTADLVNVNESFKVVRPWIWVRLGFLRIPFFFKTFQRTQQNWPVLPIESASGQPIALRWSGYELSAASFSGLFEIMRSRDAESVNQAFSRIGVPSWNFVFADVGGHIGYRAVGQVPQRGHEPSFGLSQNRGIWEYLKKEQMPHVLDPQRGYVVTANNRHWPIQSKLSGGRAYSPGFRAFRIEELLTSTPKHDLLTLKKIQCDVQAVDARFLLPAIFSLWNGGIKIGDPLVDRAIEVLQSWDLEARPDCVACGIWRRWSERIYIQLVANESALYRMILRANATERERLKKIVMSELKGVLQDLRIQSEAEFPSWEKLHLAKFRHLSGYDFGNTGLIASPGDQHSVNVGTLRWDQEQRIFEHIDGPSQRVIVELSSPPKVYAMLAGSNRDLPVDKLLVSGSAWQLWSTCQLERRRFPLDWNELREKATDVVLRK